MPITRRRFVQTASLTAAAAGMGCFTPRFVRAADKSGLGPIIVGSGEHTYEVQHDWGQLPTAIAYGNTHGVCEDSKGNIYIKHTVHATSSKADAIVVFDSDGKFIRSWGPEYRGGAHGLHLSREPDGEFLYLCDQARGVVDKTTLVGEKVWSKSAPMESGVYNIQSEYHATNIAVVPWIATSSGLKAMPHSGEFYIGDGYGKSWIHHYSAKGEYIRTFGGPGKERGQLSCPHGLMIDTRGVGIVEGKESLLVVADRANHRLQYFTLDGRHHHFVTDEMKLPCHFHTRNDVLLVPDLDSRVTLLDKDNKLIAHLCDGASQGLRDKPRDQFIPGKFICPHSAIFDHTGNIFVVEWVEVGRVTKLKKVT
jgi:hypothetical protein